MEQNDPEKKMPSTAANATSRSAKDVSLPVALPRDATPGHGIVREASGRRDGRQAGGWWFMYS